MKEAPISLCEKRFIQEAIAANKRLDGRSSNDSREVEILFGNERGCCIASLGNTKTLSKVTCLITTPKAYRPSEGNLRVNVELSPLGSAFFESGRLSDFGVEVMRLLEKCIRDSRCLDLESLCIVSGEKVWSIRVDVHVLNYDGNLLECASVAAIASLVHFRRPDVTVVGTDVTVHTLDDHNPVPLSIHHWPLCVCFAVFNQGKDVVADPTEAEERVAEGKVIVAANSHNEICTLHIDGNIVIQRDQIMMCSSRATVRAKKLTELIKKSLEEDAAARSSGKDVGFAAVPHRSDEMSRIKLVDRPASRNLDLSADGGPAPTITKQEPSSRKEAVKVFLFGAGTAAIGEGGPSKWDVDEVLVPSSSSDGETSKKNPGLRKQSEDDDESSEEEAIILQPEDIDAKMETSGESESRQWYSKNPLF